MSKPKPGPFGALECGCTVDKLGQYLDITYCSMHGAAPKLLAALEALLATEEAHGEICETDPCASCEAEYAIDEAKGGKDFPARVHAAFGGMP